MRMSADFATLPMEQLRVVGLVMFLVSPRTRQKITSDGATPGNVFHGKDFHGQDFHGNPANKTSQVFTNQERAL